MLNRSDYPRRLLHTKWPEEVQGLSSEGVSEIVSCLAFRQKERGKENE